jgi:hypothetical protein
MISQKINTNNCYTTTSDNTQNNSSFALSQVFWNSFPSIKYHCATSSEIEIIIGSFKSSNYCGYDEVFFEIVKILLSYY